MSLYQFIRHVFTFSLFIACTSLAAQVQVAGVVRAEHRAVLTSPFADLLVELPVSLSTPVMKGDVVARFECRDAQSRLGILRAEESIAAFELKVQKDLLNRSATGRAQVARADLDLGLKQAERSAQELRVDSCTITAPITGVVSRIDIHQWQAVTVGTPLLEIVDPKAVYIELVVPASVIPALQNGAKLTFRPEGSEMDFPLKVLRIGIAADLMSQLTKVHAEFVSVPETIVIGASGKATIRPGGANE